VPAGLLVSELTMRPVAVTVKWTLAMWSSRSSEEEVDALVTACIAPRLLRLTPPVLFSKKIGCYTA